MSPMLLIPLILSARSFVAQDLPPPPPAGSQAPPQVVATRPAPPDVDRLARSLSQALQDLAVGLPTGLGQSATVRGMAQDASELSQALADFRQAARSGGDTLALRQNYAGIDSGLHALRSQVDATGNPPADIDRANRRIDELDARLHDALGLNPPPRDYYHPSRAPSGLSETQRLAHALVDRSRALAAIVRADMGVTRGGRALADETDNLARQADAFHDALDLDGRTAVAARAFGPVDQVADSIEKFLVHPSTPPRVKAAWQSFASVEVLIHQNLGLDVPQPAVAVAVTPPPQGQPSPLLPLTDQLLAQVNDFLNVFGPNAGNVPEGAFLLSDARRLQAAASAFRQDLAAGADPSQLAFRFRDADLNGQRLARRVNRIARGRVGPSIQQVAKIGATLSQLHDALGIPGYAPSFLPASPPANVGVYLP